MFTTELIAAIAAGAGAVLTALGALIVNVIKAKKEKTGDKELEYGHTEALVKLVSGQTNEIQKLLKQINGVKQIVSGISKDMDKLDMKLEAFHSEQKEFNIVMLRHSILDVWASYREVGEMPLDVYNSTLNLYDRYKELGGNSFVSEVIEEMRGYKKY